jgi:FkbM family methyltransferase
MRMHPWRPQIGLLRSILIYYGNPLKLRRMRHFYAQFIRPGDLTFDIGAHVGNRLWVWSKLGANVVAVEPQQPCLTLLQRWYGRSPNIRLVGQAVGAVSGQQTLWVSEATPTVTTLSREWIATIQQADSFAHVRWEGASIVDVTTLDDLIARFGEPRFCKIDIEGYELDALQGLSQPLAALSFEYVPVANASALACVERLMQLGVYEFNWSCGEQHRWQSAHWLSADQMMEVLVRLQPGDPSGDVYARVM